VWLKRASLRMSWEMLKEGLGELERLERWVLRRVSPTRHPLIGTIG
jgi:hypothetical protein